MCRRALKIGLPALAFTEHLNLTGWVIDPGGSNRSLRTLLGDNDLLIPEPLGDRVALLGCPTCSWPSVRRRTVRRVGLGCGCLSRAARAGAWLGSASALAACRATDLAVGAG
jgi:hypothetical protein